MSGSGHDRFRRRLDFSGRKRVPVHLQDESAECGQACLSMIAAFHGLGIDLASIRRKFPGSSRGTTMESLVNMAHGFGLRTRPLRLDASDLVELNLPCVLHWDESHYVVLVSLSGKEAVIHDPARGRLVMARSELARHFSGVALEIVPGPDFAPRKELQKLSISQLWSSSHGLTKAVTVLLGMTLVLQVFSILMPFFMQLVVDEVLVSANQDLLLVLALGFGLLMLAQSATTWLRSTLLLLFTSQLSVQVAGNLLHHLLHLPMRFFERRHIGDITSRFGSLEQVREQLTSGLVEAIVDGLLVVGALVMMWLYAPSLTVVVLVAVLFYSAVRVATYQRQADLVSEGIAAKARTDSNFLETLRAMQVVKLQGRELRREILWHNRFVDTQNASIRSGRLRNAQMAINAVTFGVENLLVVFLGAKLVIAGSLTVGMLLAFLAYKGQFGPKASGLVEKWMQFRLIRLHLDRVADIALTEPERDPANPLPLPEGPLALSLEGVSFRYSEQEPYLFQSLDASFPSGESVVIVGPSGTGKTTLMKVLLGLLEPEHGKILLNGHDIRQIGLRRYRQCIGAVMQDDVLLAGSISDNIAFFDEQPDRERIQLAARNAAIHDDIMRLPMGYETPIGDMGSALSGGQRQRLILARALYREPRILIMDEATSHLDVHLEAQVNRAMAKLNICRILIAHRPETIRSADRILMLSNGQLTPVSREQALPSTGPRAVPA